MKVIIRYPQHHEVIIRGARRVADLLRELRLNPETVITLQGPTLLTHDVLLQDDAVVEVRSAISGG